MRQPAFPTTQSALYPDGTNLSQVLNTMKISNRNAFKQIEEAIIEINRHYSGISFNHLANNIELLIEEEPFDHAVHISNISDGTLRFLCLMAILYNPNRGSVVCIDEPELGLHPDMILTLFEAIKYASKTSQIIISTHSAQLLDCFDLNQVIVFEKNKENATVVKQGMKEEDFSAWKDDYFVGKMWRSGAIGGNRW
ncbi:MAG TPA: AAA family ATPase [Chitinophagales bacterium]|nr:AAA family ATPase [Chitinophagales bacterium]